MRFLIDVSIPNDAFNAAIRAGTIASSMMEIVQATKPEAIYFCERHGQRGCTLIVNIDNPSQIPAIAEPWFLRFNAKVSFHPVMSPEELGAANVDGLAKQWG